MREAEQMVTVPRYLAWDEGCIECGEKSGAVGFFATKDEAVAALTAASRRQRENWHGQHEFYVIDLADPVKSEHAQ